MTDFMTIAAVMLAGVSVVLAYLPRAEAVAAALAALLCAGLGGGVPVGSSTLWFWAVAAMFAYGIQMLLPAPVRRSRLGVSFFATGALAGTAVGVAMMSSAAVICASAVGVFLGAVAVSRMNAGRSLDFPSKRFFNYLLAKGLPLVVTFAMLGVLLLHVMARQPQ